MAMRSSVDITLILHHGLGGVALPSESATPDLLAQAG
jgi:hypothetical protein